MTAFMVSSDIHIFVAEDQWTFCPEQDLIQGLFKAALVHRIQVATCGKECSFIDQVRQICTDHTSRRAGNSHQVYILIQRHLACMNLENSQTPIPVGTINNHSTIEATGAQQGLIKPIRTVCCGDNHNGLMTIKAIHLYQELVQRLLSLIIGVNAGTALPSHGINFVDKDDTWRSLLGLIKEVTHTASADADQHLHEFGARHREEWHGSFACYSSSQ